MLFILFCACVCLPHWLALCCPQVSLLSHNVWCAIVKIVTFALPLLKILVFTTLKVATVTFVLLLRILCAVHFVGVVTCVVLMPDALINPHWIVLTHLCFFHSDHRERVDEIEKLWETLLAQTEKKGMSQGLGSQVMSSGWSLRSEVAGWCGRAKRHVHQLAFCAVGVWDRSPSSHLQPTLPQLVLP